MKKTKEAANTAKGALDPAVYEHFERSPTSVSARNGAVLVTVGVFALVFACSCGAFWLATGTVGFAEFLVSLVVAAVLCMSVHVAQQWERAVVFRLGRLNRVVGPGPFLTIPFIEYSVIKIDQRVRTTAFGAEETLTSDLVPLDVDAVLFWNVWDVEKACTEVDNYPLAVRSSAQTILRDAIGRASISEVAMRRNQLDRELKHLLEEKVTPWGISVASVEIRDIQVPEKLQDTMSLEAQAEQRKKARIALMEAEQEIYEMFKDMKDENIVDEQAMRMRAMHLLYESVHDTGGTVVVPSSFSEGFTDIFGKDGAK
ncbi:MAG: slipin family protein [Gordonibacter sp.]